MQYGISLEYSLGICFLFKSFNWSIQNLFVTCNIVKVAKHWQTIIAKNFLQHLTVDILHRCPLQIVRMKIASEPDIVRSWTECNCHFFHYEYTISHIVCTYLNTLAQFFKSQNELISPSWKIWLEKKNREHLLILSECEKPQNELMEFTLHQLNFQ